MQSSSKKNSAAIYFSDRIPMKKVEKKMHKN